MMANAVAVAPSGVEQSGLQASAEVGRPRSGRRTPKVPRRVGVTMGAVTVAVLLFGHAGWMMWRSSQQVHEAERLRSELVDSARALDTERPRLDSAQAEAADASNALSAALAALEPGATASSKDADLAAGRSALTSLQSALDATVAARGFESSERDRLVSCLASAEQALGVAQTDPSNTSSLYALATESCRDATTGAFSAIAG